MQPGTTVAWTETETAAGWCRYLSAAPSARLCPVTRRIDAYEEAGMPGVARTETPMLAVPLIVTFAGSFAIGDGTRTGPPLRSFVAGLHRGPVQVASSGDACCLQIDLTPQAAMRLLRCDLAELADRTVDLADLVGAEAALLEERLAAARTWDARFALFDAFVADRLASDASQAPLLDHALSAIHRSRGNLRIGDLAAQIGVSRKHLTAVLRRATGQSPGLLARIARFAHAAALMRAPARPTLAQVALDAGYADQAHFNRAFRSFAGMTPGDYLKADPPS